MLTQFLSIKSNNSGKGYVKIVLSVAQKTGSHARCGKNLTEISMASAAWIRLRRWCRKSSLTRSKDWHAGLKKVSLVPVILLKSRTTRSDVILARVHMPLWKWRLTNQLAWSLLSKFMRNSTWMRTSASNQLKERFWWWKNFSTIT